MMLHTSCSELCERTADVILSEGHFLRHLMRLQDRVREATAGGLRVLDELGAEVFCRPEQSLYLWARFPRIDDTAVLTREVQGRGVTRAPGAIFQTNQKTVTPWTREEASTGNPFKGRDKRSLQVAAFRQISLKLGFWNHAAARSPHKVSGILQMSWGKALASQILVCL